MTGDGWVWIGNVGIAASLLQAEKDVSIASQGMIAVSPKSKLNKIVFSKNCQFLGGLHFYYPDTPDLKHWQNFFTSTLFIQALSCGLMKHISCFCSPGVKKLKFL